ncbi:ABC transporter ATP-binding protein [Kocuria sp. cx-116]|uniref:ATP-binding cassette domain-containing protein n=1 Tax=Kocuria sp. cx-116 TaxID=2771378 RepID=UPI001681EC2C|nr:ABC transporter ATP-binding protein [Kocuria sp. cx-116]MBD2763085.1 ABC transporter ATP-binding protein [Kocuria sp. cx-116]
MSSQTLQADHRTGTPWDTGQQGIRIRNLNKSFGKKHVLKDVTVDFAPHRVHGLLGANGVGKTTLMSVILNHTFRSSGEILIDGEDPRENAKLLERTCFIHEDQKFHDDDTPASLLRILPTFYPNWDAQLAERLASRFQLPMGTRAVKLSRGQRSALVIVIALSSRAPYTFMDEPYLGLDPGHRALFYEEFARAMAEHPRTVILSTHLIDEVSDLLENVVMLEDGRVTVDADIDQARDSAFVLRGLEPVVRELAGGRRILREHRLGNILSVTVDGTATDGDHRRAHEANVSVEPVTLQELVAARGMRGADNADRGL